jgi:putative membrane protein
MMYYGSNMGSWAMALMIFGNLVFWTVLILGAVVVRRFWRSGSPSDSRYAQVKPRQLLAERFARGEITEGDYLQSLRVLSDHHVSPLR